MENVRVGDKVRCISDSSYRFTKGKIYEVLRVYLDNFNNERISAFDDKGDLNGWWAENFELIKETNIPTYERNIFTGKLDINIPKIPDINMQKLAQQLYEGVQKDMKVMSIKQLHNDIQNIYFNEEKRTTVIVFKNGDKVKATASKDTPFSEYAGFVTALFKYEKGLKLKDVEHLIKKKRG